MDDKKRWEMALEVVPVIEWWMKLRRIPPESRDDARQNALVHLHRKAPKWVPERASWPTFSIYVIRSALRQSFYDARGYGPRNDRTEACARTSLCKIEDLHTDPEAQLISLLDQQIDGSALGAFIDSLTEIERAAILRHRDDLTLKDVGAAFGCSREWIRLVETKVLTKLRAKIGIRV